MSPIEDSNIEAVGRHLLRQGPDRRDADSAGDEQDLRILRSFDELAERAVDQDRSAGLQGVDVAGEVADVLDRDSQAPPVGDRRDRERVCLPPALAIDETPDRELARLGLELVQVAAGDVDREDAARLLLDRLDVKTVAPE